MENIAQVQCGLQIQARLVRSLSTHNGGGLYQIKPNAGDTSTLLHFYAEDGRTVAPISLKHFWLRTHHRLSYSSLLQAGLLCGLVCFGFLPQLIWELGVHSVHNCEQASQQAAPTHTTRLISIGCDPVHSDALCRVISFT